MPNSIARGVSYEDPAIVGGSLDNSPVGATTKSTGAFTTLNATGATTLDGNVAIGNAAGDLVAFHGATAVAQASTVASVSTTIALATTSVTTVYGFYNSAQPAALIAAVNSILTALQNKGLIA